MFYGGLIVSSAARLIFGSAGGAGNSRGFVPAAGVRTGISRDHDDNRISLTINDDARSDE